MMTWKQKCEEERFYYIIEWNYTGDDNEPYDRNCVARDLTLEEAKTMFNKYKVDGIHDQVEIWQEFSEECVEKIALKDRDFETWDRDEM